MNLYGTATISITDARGGVFTGTIALKSLYEAAKRTDFSSIGELIGFLKGRIDLSEVKPEDVEFNLGRHASVGAFFDSIIAKVEHKPTEIEIKIEDVIHGLTVYIAEHPQTVGGGQRTLKYELTQMLMRHQAEGLSGWDASELFGQNMRDTYFGIRGYKDMAEQELQELIENNLLDTEVQEFTSLQEFMEQYGPESGEEYDFVE